MTTMASQITILTVVYSTVYSDVDKKKHQSSASLAFVWGIHRDRWIPRTKGQLRGKCFHLMMSSWEMSSLSCHFCLSLNEGCQNVNFRCSWWRKYRQNDNFQFQYWGQNIMAAILQKTFQVAFFQRKFLFFDSDVSQTCSWSSTNSNVSLLLEMDGWRQGETGMALCNAAYMPQSVNVLIMIYGFNTKRHWDRMYQIVLQVCVYTRVCLTLYQFANIYWDHNYH